MRHAIARWLSPELSRKAEERDWLVSEISHNARWLSEFKFVSRTLDRLLERLVDQFRPIDAPAIGKEPSDISAYRELLRREANPPLAWNHPSNRSYGPVEKMAKQIYDGFVYDGPTGTSKPAWTPGGNGTKQDEARDIARRALSMAGHVPEYLVVAG